MKKATKRILCVLLCVVMAFTSISVGFSVLADRKTDLSNDIADLEREAAAIQKDINDLKKQQKDQQSIVNAIQRKVANTQAKITRCNREIESINAKISANKAEIDKKNKEIDKNKLDFKKRIRAIYMSNSDSSVKILLGAEDFSNFLQLSQLTAAVSSRDKAMIEDIVAAIEEINKKNAENEQLLKSQVAIKETIQVELNKLKAEEDEAEGLLKSIASQKNEKEDDKDDIEAEIKAKENELNSILGGVNISNSKINPISGFMWPVPGHYNVTSGYGYRIHPITGKKKLHAGIDIATSNIYQKPIVAITDGDIFKSYTSCPHRSKKPICSCGGGYGNYVAIDHGKITINGKQDQYTAYYAHMDTVAKSSGSVKQGQLLGYVGTTGSSTGYHLHFGLAKNGKYDGWVNPSNYF